MEETITVTFKKGIESIVFCPQCRKNLYEMPVPIKDIFGVYRRVTLNSVNGHTDVYTEHTPVIVGRPDGNEVKTG